MCYEGRPFSGRVSGPLTHLTLGSVREKRDRRQGTDTYPRTTDSHPVPDGGPKRLGS